MAQGSSPKNLGSSEAGQCYVGNPINQGTGNKFQREVDYSGLGQFPIRFVRYYNSTPGFFTSYWSYTYGQQIQLASAVSANVVRPDGKAYNFNLVNGVWSSDADVNAGLVEQTDSSGNPLGWQYTDSDDQVETYDGSGKLLTITNRAGLTQVLAYSDSTTPATVAPSTGLLIRVTDSQGRQLNFTYDSLGRMATMENPGGGVYQYTYDPVSNIASVTYPDSFTKQYVYGESADTGGASQPNALTGINDENGNRYATYEYDTQGRAVVSEHGPNLAGGPVAKYSLAYNSDGSTTVTDPLLSARTYSFTTVLGVAKGTGVSQPGGSGCAAASSAQSYDTNGNVLSRDDFNGHRSCYAYTATRNLETGRLEGLSSTTACPAPLTPAPGTQQRLIQRQWHPDWRLEAQRAEPEKLTTWVYNGQPDPSAGGTAASCAPSGALLPNGKPIAVLCKRIEQATTDLTGTAGFGATATGSPRVSTWTYNSQGQVLLATGPRGNLAHTDPNYAPSTTTYGYYTSNDPSGNWRVNDLKSVTDALGHTTSINQYDQNGRPLTVIDPNLVTTTFAYTPRGSLQSQSTGGATTMFGYDKAGQLTKVTLPDGSYVTFALDAAHRLTGITDNLGNQVTYTLDNLGNRTAEKWNNPDGSVAQSHTRNFDLLGRLYQAIGAANQTTQYAYDAQGNLTGMTGPKSQVSNLSYDVLNRLISLQDALNGLTQLGYDPLDHVTSVTAPNGAVTQYTVDGLGNVNQEIAADRGTIAATYDVAGNRLARTDARGIAATYAYDALNRLTSITYPSTGENVGFVWDAVSGCTYGVGRLCQVTDASGSVTFAYDARGNLVQETRLEDGVSTATQYVPDLVDRLQSLAAPTGETLSVQRNAGGQITQVSTTAVAGTSVVAQAIQYNAPGRVTAQTLGMSASESIQYTQDGRVQAQNVTLPSDGDVPLPAWSLVLLGAGLLGSLIKRGRAAVAYVAALTVALGLFAGLPVSGYATDLSQSYDPNGNVISKTTPSGTATLTYDPLDRVSTEAGLNGTRTHGYDANGNHLSNGAGSTATYTPNSDRIATINGSSVGVVTLDVAGNLTSDGNFNYVWNQAGQLAELTKLDHTLIASYTYDFRGLRKRKVTTAAAPQGAGTTYYHYDPQGHLVAETGPGGIALMTYLWRDDTLTGLIVHQPTRTIYTVETDALGSPLQVRTLAGQVVWRWEPEAYGATQPNEDVDGDGTLLILNLRFPGQYYDVESGLHYNGKRYYSPTLGRYLSPDPIGLAAGPNMYTYVHGNPLTRIDPNGEDWKSIIQTIGVAIGLAGNPDIAPKAPPTPPISSGSPSEGEAIGMENPSLPEQFPPLPSQPTPPTNPVPVAEPAAGLLPEALPVAASGLGILPIITIGGILGVVPGNVGQNNPCILGDLCTPPPQACH